MGSIGFINQSKAQCSGATITINNFLYLPGSGIVSYNYDWKFEHGNASIELVFQCNGTEVASVPCIPNIKDFPGTHNVTGSLVIPTTCVGTLRMLVKVWSNNSCGGTSCNENTRDISNITLPVSFKSFSASRNNSAVLIKWETTDEANSRGFALERNNGNGIWNQVAFISSQAVNGFSNTDLSYQYTDANNSKAITQYRIRQVDLNDKAKISDIRSVRGIDQKGEVILYPNPSNDGKVNIVFEDRNIVRDVAVTDMSGRIVKQLKSVSANSVTIDNLVSGMYTIRISVPGTGEQVIEKVIVNKH